MSIAKVSFGPISQTKHMTYQIASTREQSRGQIASTRQGSRGQYLWPTWPGVMNFADLFFCILNMSIFIVLRDAWLLRLLDLFTGAVLSIPQHTKLLISKTQLKHRMVFWRHRMWIYLIKNVYDLWIILQFNKPYIMKIYWILVKWEICIYCSVIISLDFGLNKKYEFT